MKECWLSTLHTDTPQDGFELAVKISHLGMMVSQTSADDGCGAHPIERNSSTQFIQIAHVIALNFQTIAAANDWWRQPQATRN
jgi:hypothetical protein